MESGIYIRVDKKNVLLEQMTIDQRTEWLNSLDKSGLIRTINVLCACLQQYEDNEDELDYEDYIQYRGKYMEIWLYSNPYLNESGISKKVKFKLNTRSNNVNRSKWKW